MKQLIVMKWLPASGKSTRAKEIMDSKPKNTIVRLNRDLLRQMMHFWEYSTLNEREIMNVEKILAQYFLKYDFDVIIDDTNLKTKNLNLWKDVAEICDADLEIVNMNTPLDECIERDSKRVNPVWEKAIRAMIQYNHNVNSH